MNRVFAFSVVTIAAMAQISRAAPIASVEVTGLSDADQPNANPEIGFLGEIPVGGTGYRLIRVTNTGDGELELGTPTTSGDFEVLSLKGEDTELEADESALYFVAYTPSEAGQVIGSCFFPHNGGPGSDISVTLTAVGVAKDIPAIHVSGEASDIFSGDTSSFGLEEIGDPEDYTITIFNVGTEPLEIGEVTSSDPTLTVDKQPSASIEPGNSSTFKLLNLAETPGERTSTISFSTNVATLAKFSFTAAFGVEPEESVIEVKSDDEVLTSGSTYIATVTNEDDEDDGEIEIELENIGTATLNIDSVVLTGPFSTEFATASLEADESDTIDITFDASTPGLQTGTLTITTDSVVNPVFTLNLEANVIPENTAFLLATVNGDDDELEPGDDIEFPKRPVGVNPQRTLTLANLGSVAIEFTSITTTPGFSTSLSSATIDAGSSASAIISSVPTRPGKQRGQLVLNGPTSRVVFRLESEATAAGSVIQVFQGPDLLSLRDEGKFPPVYAGSTAAAQLLVTNVGDGPVQLGGVSSTTPGVSGVNFDALVGAGETISATLLFAPETERVPKSIVVSIATDNKLVPSVGIKMETEFRDTPCEITVFDEDDNDVSNDSDVDFGATEVGNPVQRTFDIVNSGIGDLTIRKLKAPRGFRVVTPPANLLEPGESTSFVVEMTALRSGNPRGKVSCSTNDRDEKKFSFNVDGTVALALSAPPPSWEDSVDVQMVARVLSRYGASGADLDEDLNDDGVVDVADLIESLSVE